MDKPDGMRRMFLLGASATLATALLPRSPRADAPRRLALRHAATGAQFAGIWHDGVQADPLAMQDLSAVLADPGCPPRPFDPAAIEIVWEIAARTRLGDTLEVHSGYRTPQVNRAVHGAGDSMHLRASALDVGVPSGRLPAVAEAAVRMQRGGVGVYRQRGFVHLDSGPVRNWSDGGGRVRLVVDPRAEMLERMAAAWRRGG
jgi:uncharacterized protein YcbK (DUF882 family)